MDEKLDASCGSWLSLDETCFFQGYHHLVDGRCSDLEMATHIGLGGRLFEDPTIGVDEG